MERALQPEDLEESVYEYQRRDKKLGWTPDLGKGVKWCDACAMPPPPPPPCRAGSNTHDAVLRAGHLGVTNMVHRKRARAVVSRRDATRRPHSALGCAPQAPTGHIPAARVAVDHPVAGGPHAIA